MNLTNPQITQRQARIEQLNTKLKFVEAENINLSLLLNKKINENATLRDDNRELREANAELIEGLKRYNRHLMHCDRLDYHDAGKGECTCGLEELIAKMLTFKRKEWK